MRALSLTLGLTVALLGCREDAGSPDYSSLADVFERANEAQDSEAYEGPDPYVPGEDRLSLGIFYEGGYSELVPIDGASSNYYIFLADGQLSYTQGSDPDRVEGQSSDLLTLAGTSWWGGGIVWEPSRDLSPWSVLAVSLKSNDLADVNITVGSSSNEVAVPATDYGFLNDGEWHNLVIPLSDFEAGGVSLSDIRVAFALGEVGGSAGSRLLVDNVYME